MLSLRSFWRSLRVIEHLITGALLALAVSLLARAGRCPAGLPRIVRWWYARLCRALGVRQVIRGRPEADCLLVGNHVSWLDIPVLGAQGEIGFLSKSEVRDWPLVGWMADIAGTRFIERGAHQTETVASNLAADLRQGRARMIFPEGTTTDGRGVRRFHSRLFGVALSPGLRIQPVAIAYRREGEQTPDVQVPYVGDDTLIANLWRLIRHPGLVALVEFLPPISVAGADTRRVLAERTRLAIVEALGLDPQAAPCPARPVPAESPEPLASQVEPRPV